MTNGKVGGTEAASVKFILKSRHCRALGGKLKLEPQAAVPRWGRARVPQNTRSGGVLIGTPPELRVLSRDISEADAPSRAVPILMEISGEIYRDDEGRWLDLT